MPTTTETAPQPRTLTPQELALLVRATRETRGWSQEQLADIAQLSTRTVQRVEEGLPSSIDTRRALASALGFEDIDALNKPHVIPTAEQLAQEKERFDKEHVTLAAERITSGKQLGQLMEQASAHMGHEAADLPPPASETFARLMDYCRDYADCDELYSAVDKLDVYGDLDRMVQTLTAYGFTVCAALRNTQVTVQGSSEGTPLTIAYLVATPSAEVPAQLLVTRQVRFGG